MRKSLHILSFLLIIAGCAGIFMSSEKERELRHGNIPSSLHPEWMRADRCTKCHQIWAWEYGYYRGLDRYGYIADYDQTAPFGYNDPWGMGFEGKNTFAEYYYTDWPGQNLPSEPLFQFPSMDLTGYGRINDGTAKPEDFTERVIVVDQSGKGDARTINEGIRRAAKGDVVFVRAGTYNETVRLKEGVTLWGENAHTTIIDPDLTGHGIIAANNCDISGFTLTGTGLNYNTYEFSAGIWALDSDSTLVIRGNIFCSNAVFGVLVESSRAGGTPQNRKDRYIPINKSLSDLEYTSRPNPRIIGNTFYRTGERGVFCIHADPQVANNIFIGNVKTLGMTQMSRPFIHNNVFYRNNVPINMNRSEPVIINNIMANNLWGQRIIEGVRPYIRQNVTWDSPYFKEFCEDGTLIAYTPIPGDGELEINPGFVDPDEGDFRLRPDSPLASLPSGTYGLVFDEGVQTPPVITLKSSYGEEFSNKSRKNDELLEAVASERNRISHLTASYTIEYKSWMDVIYHPGGDHKSMTLREEPVSGFTYEADFRMTGRNRVKNWKSEHFHGEEKKTEQGTVSFLNCKLTSTGGNYLPPVANDSFRTREEPLRENMGGIFLDFDQYLNGAIGPGGTFWYGYLHMLGGGFYENEVLDGYECLVIRYPHLGSDQYYLFWIAPDLGYKPLKLEQYFERELYRRVDGYRYRKINGIHVPVEVKMTDFVIKGPHKGEVAGRTVMRVSEVNVN